MLQPLDVFVFARFKLQVRQQLHQQLLSAASQYQSNQHVPKTCLEIIQRFLLQQSWSHCFTKLGYTDRQQKITPRILRQLQWIQLPEIPVTKPTLQEITPCFPKNRLIPFRTLFPDEPPLSTELAHTTTPATAAPRIPIGHPLIDPMSITTITTRSRSRAWAKSGVNALLPSSLH